LPLRRFTAATVTPPTSTTAAIDFLHLRVVQPGRIAIADHHHTGHCQRRGGGQRHGCAGDFRAAVC
jgi:hypothetical protein